MNSARAYLGAGGIAEWSFLAFRHNEHQVETARSLSLAMGFHSFTVKRSNRFSRKDGDWLPFPVVDGQGRILYHLEPPKSPTLQNAQVRQLEDATSVTGARENYMAGTPIHCKARKARKIYITAEGLVLPCCWLGGIYDRQAADGRAELWDLLDKLPDGLSSLNARLRPLERIIAEPFFQSWIPARWDAGNARLRTCSRVCGAIDIKAGQYGH
jgi:hypothetical protein